MAKSSAYSGVTQILESNWKQRIAYDGSDRPEYIGVALPGTAENAVGWAIRKIVYSVTGQATEINWANSSNEFSFVWDSRAGYTYA